MAQLPMSLPQSEQQSAEQGTGGGCGVVVYNNEHNTFEEVIAILQHATGCDRTEAEMETWEIHHVGWSLVHHGSREECERAASIISTIGIRVEVREI